MLSAKEKLVNVNSENPAGETPISVAAAEGHVRIVKRLLRVKGIRLKDGCGEKAVIQAIENGHFESAQLIMAAIEKKDIATNMIKPKNLLISCLNRYAMLANELSSGGGGSMTEDDVEKINQRLDSYRKSIVSIVSSPSEPEPKGVPNKKKSIKESSDELKECLECTICCESFEDRGGVFACTRDHWICPQCLPHNDRCPSCREDFNEHPPTRRVTYEKILNMIQDHLSLCDK